MCSKIWSLLIICQGEVYRGHMTIFEPSPHWFPQWPYHLHSYQRGSFPRQHFMFVFLTVAILNRLRQNLKLFGICISTMLNYVAHYKLFLSYLFYSFEKWLLSSITDCPFVGLFVSSCFFIIISLDSLETNLYHIKLTEKNLLLLKETGQ